MTLYQATTSYFCAGLIIHNSIIIEAAPIIKWAERKPFYIFKTWLRKKNGTLVKVKEKC